MSAKKRGQNPASTPFDPQTVAAITRDIPGLLAKAGYFNSQTTKPVIKTEMFDHSVITTDRQERPARETNQPKTIPEPVPRGDRLKLVYAVVGFGALVAAIWIFNVRNTISTAWENPIDRTLVDQSTEDFNTVLETIKNNDRMVREKLNQNASLDPITQNQLEQAIKEAVQPTTGQVKPNP